MWECSTSLDADHLGRPVFGTDAEGTVVWRGGITTPFGLSVTGASALSAPGATPLRFPGQYADAETARGGAAGSGDGGGATLWHYNHHRTYDPALSRYLQSDPIGRQGGINRYAYVGGNPVGWVDPEGLEFVPPGGRGSGYVTLKGGAVSHWVADKLGLGGKGSSVVCGCGTPPKDDNLDIDFIRANGEWFKIKDGEALVLSNQVKAGRLNRWYLKPVSLVYRPRMQHFYWNLKDSLDNGVGPVGYLENLRNFSADPSCAQLPGLPLPAPPSPGTPKAVGI